MLLLRVSPGLRTALAILCSCAALAQTSGPSGNETVTGRVKGTATYRERMALPADAVFEATLEEISKTGAPAQAIARTQIKDPGNPPISFEIAYDPSRIDASHSYGVRARILVDGKPFFVTDRAHPVITTGQTNGVALMLRRSGSSPDNTAAASLENTYWILKDLGDATVHAASHEREPHLVFDSKTKRVLGSGGCNSVTGSYTVSGNRLTLGQMASTMMACAEGMETETKFLRALPKVKTWKVTGRELELSDAGGQLVARFQARNGE